MNLIQRGLKRRILVRSTFKCEMKNKKLQIKFRKLKVTKSKIISQNRLLNIKLKTNYTVLLNPIIKVNRVIIQKLRTTLKLTNNMIESLKTQVRSLITKIRLKTLEICLTWMNPNLSKVQFIFHTHQVNLSILPDN